MDLLEKLKQHMLLNPYVEPKQMQLVAVSGGADSIVLCDLMFKTGYNFIIAHCNFQLRGEESEGDERFVRSLGEKYGKEVFVQRFETKKYAAEEKTAIQEAARNLRYNWFWQLVHSERKAHHILTAHHADDNIETAVMNFFRGTGIKGLTGMGYQPYLFRPLLPFRKQEILAYAKQNELLYREDSSNALNDYTRNYFRNELLPGVRKVYPAADKNILENIDRFKDVETLYKQAIETHKKNLVKIIGHEEHIPILKLKKTYPLRTVLWEIIREKYFTSGQIDEVIKLMDNSNGSYIKSEFHRIIKNRKWLIITQTHLDEHNEHFVIDPQDKKRHFEKERLSFEKLKADAGFKIPASPGIACLDADLVTFPLLLRKWKQGDYFYPLGMKKKKKLSRFFIDQKLSMTDKENAWVLEMDKKIIWVVGLRIDDRFKITPSTKNILRVEFRMK